MLPRQLREFETLLDSADAVVSMREVWLGRDEENVIGLRHDVDDNPGSLTTAEKMAQWEAARGFRSTYYLLHTASYWGELDFPYVLDTIAGLGHEIGIHANAITEALTLGGDPFEILTAAIEYLRGLGHQVDGVAAHGDQLCYLAGFVNDELFLECPRPEMGGPRRVVGYAGRHVRLDPRPFADYGLRYDAHRLPHGRYLSDSGGRWNEPFPGIGEGQLHVLQHPDWWARAFRSETVTIEGG